MKKLLFALAGALLLAATCYFSFDVSAQSSVPQQDAIQTSPNIVISQFQAGGSVADDEFVELHNIGSAAVDLNGYRLVYRSSSGTNDVGPFALWTTPTVIQPGQYYLVASTSYDGGVTPDITYNPATCTCSMSASAGGLAIRQGAQNTGTIIDAVGWGGATNIFFEGTRTSAPPVNTSQIRAFNGCQDTDNNSADFSNFNPAVARNTSTAASVCGGGGASLFAALAVNPNTVTPGGTTLLTVTVIPATTPPSTNIAVVGNLNFIGGSDAQNFFDDGTNGDATAGDNVFSYLASISNATAGGPHLIVVVAADAQGRVVTMQQNVTVNAPLPNEDPLLLGNPSGATGDPANENNYLMVKSQYTLSYNRANATPNWVAWRLDQSWLGGADRQNDYRPDPALPAGWYQVTDVDYSGSGYDRGHMCPSGDRTRTVADNSTTFLMTNFIPQLGANNQGPWNDFEIYSRSLANSGNEVYIISGPKGSLGTIAQGKVNVPQATWKVVLVLPNGSDDLHRITKATRAFGIIVPNQPPIVTTQWRNYRVTVNAVEALTGYDFFNQVPKITQEIIERRHDTQ
jgi:endonuclease G